MLRKKVAPLLAALGIVAAGAIPASTATALTWHQFHSGTLPTSYAAGGPVTTIWGQGMTDCTGGSWTRRLQTRNGGFVVHGHSFSGLYCPGFDYFGHDHPGSYTVCWNGSGTTEAANCWTRI